MTEQQPIENIPPHPLDPTRYPTLSKVESPADLRQMSIEEMETLCREIRSFIVESVSVNPGHFASSMGAVELTVALHYVFDTPEDRIVWDVGHQAYGHKLLTGRAPLFYTNRQLGGLSGFPNPSESIYDTFTAGHASNSVSAALGMAAASRLKEEGKGGKRRNVVAVIGDASIGGGLAFEGLNNAADSADNLLIILNDNDMSIDPNVGSLNSYLAHINTSKSYNTLRYNVYRGLQRLHLISPDNRGRILRFNNSLKSMLTKEQNIFEGLNIRYFGPFDGHDLRRIIRVLTDIRDMRGPRLLHLRTIKGCGYAPAEKDPSAWHAPGLFNPATGKKIKSSATAPKWQEIFGHTLTELAKEDSRVTAITAAMSSGTSVNIMQREYPERTFDVGISEGHAVTFAGGLAKEGLLPFVAIYSSFLQRAYDHIIHDVAIMGLPVTFCIDRAGLVGEDGVTHHGIFDIAYLRNIPGITLAAPRTDSQLKALMRSAISPGRRGPMAIRYPRGSALVETPSDKPGLSPTLLRNGDDVTMLTVGPIASEAMKAITEAAKEGIEVAHYDMLFISPLDDKTMEEIAHRGKPIITVEDGIRNGGFGSAVTEWLSDHGHLLPVRRLGIPQSFVGHGTVSQLRSLCGIDAPSILKTIIETAKHTHT
ncbi:MAG: 1-deoxy-D-xylulose-5-phosphate synthase [Pseudoflavonifractor sp.]|nr:1-deoxy-D-xylulose-5-phosphate synthase [Alloprevotella sp.]MCM1117353.1 1-deoxy-D-xylulose-5-phosphate synthase [Pseudoflavonifractor sp.]